MAVKEQAARVKKQVEEDRKETEDLLKQKGMIEFNEEGKGAAGSEAVQITNDLYNRIKFMEMAAFFFGYAGLGMAVIEYELRYFLINGEFIENNITGVPAPPIGVNDHKKNRLQILLVLNLICTLMTCFAILSRYRLTLRWKIQKNLLIPSDTLFTTKEYQNIILENFLMILAPFPGIQDSYINEYYPDQTDPDTGNKGVHKKLYVNWVLLSIAMTLRMYLLIRFLITFTRFRSAR